MTCTHCGATIAAKALICYKCGHATTEPRIKPPATESLFDRPRRSRGRLVLIAVIIALLGGGAVDYFSDGQLDFNVTVE